MNKNNEFRAAIISISGSLKAFSKDYGIDYQAVLRWVKNGPPKAAVALVKEILRSK